MTITFLSDTHGKHHELQNLPQADMLIHAGDLSWNGTEEITDFIEWFEALNYRHKIFIAGNHDDCLDRASIEGMPHDCYYLCNSGIEIEGVKIWESRSFYPTKSTGQTFIRRKSPGFLNRPTYWLRIVRRSEF